MKKISDYFFAGIFILACFVGFVSIVYDCLKGQPTRKVIKYIFIILLVILFYIGGIWLIRKYASIHLKQSISSTINLSFIVIFIVSLIVGSSTQGTNQKANTIVHIFGEIAFYIRFVLLALLPFLIALEW